MSSESEGDTVDKDNRVSRVVFRGPNSDVMLADYLANLGAYETEEETEYVDPGTGCAVTKKVVWLMTFIEGGGVDEQTVEEYDEFGNLDKKFVLQSTSVTDTGEVCRTIELISERAAAATHKVVAESDTDAAEDEPKSKSRKNSEENIEASSFKDTENGGTQASYHIELFYTPYVLHHTLTLIGENS